MRTLTVTEAKARLNELVEDTEETHEQIVITRHGHPAAVLIAAADLESLQEAVFWLSQPGITDTVKQARAEIESGEGPTTEELRAELGLPPR